MALLHKIPQRVQLRELITTLSEVFTCNFGIVVTSNIKNDL